MTSERALQLQVHDLLRAAPELVWHHCGSSHLCAGQGGMPDLLVIGPRRLMWRELKGDTTPLRRAQRDFGQALTAAGESWGVWRPDDMQSGRIDMELQALRHPG